MTRAELLADEARRARKVTQIVDIATALITQSAMSRIEAEALVEYARAAILELFPDGAQTFEVVYARRFRRLIDDCTPPLPPHPPGVVIPFPGPRR
jgi:hypothetical protein